MARAPASGSGGAMSDMFSAEQDDQRTDPDDVEIGVEENVYSFFQFIVPSEKKKEGKGLTMDILVARFLVALCIAMQLLALFAIYQAVVLKDVKWSKKNYDGWWQIMGLVRRVGPRVQRWRLPVPTERRH